MNLNLLKKLTFLILCLSLVQSLSAQGGCPPSTISGTLGSGSIDWPSVSGNQTGRLTRNGIASSCMSPKACQIFDPTGARAFDAYTFTNSSASDACVTVDLNVLTQTAANYQSNAYLASFVPSNICMNYLADPGLSSGIPPTATSYSFMVPAGEDLIVVVHTTNPGEIGGDYELTFTGLDAFCASACACVDQGATLNAKDLNLSLAPNGDACFALCELVSNPSCTELYDILIETEAGQKIYSANDLAYSEMICLSACQYLTRKLKATVTTQNGTSAWGYLTFKQGNGPLIYGRSKDVYCFDPLVAGGDINDEPPLALIPCIGEVPARFVADWVIAYDCEEPGNPVNDTAKVIIREYEAFDKQGIRGVAYDTITVFRLPAIDVAEIPNVYCAESDTLYCGEGGPGPFMLYPERCVPELFGSDQDGDGVACDTLYFLLYDDSLRRYILNPALSETKCGLLTHLDYWPFESGDCEFVGKYVLEIKQECITAFNSLCPITQPQLATNVFEEISVGYYRCEFWITDLDTLGPEVVCKGDELFTGPFAIPYWELISNPVTILTGAQSAVPLEQEVDYFDLSKLPYQVIINSVKPEEGEVFPPLSQRNGQMDTEPSESVTAANGFYPYFADAEMIYVAEEDGVFDFAWDFTLEPGMQNFGRTIEETACVSVSMGLNGTYYRIVEQDYPSMCILLPPNQDPQAAAISVPPVGVINSQNGILSVPLKKGDVFSINAAWISSRRATFRILGPKIVNTTTHECAGHSYIPNVYVEDDWTGIKQVKAVVEGIGTYVMTYNAEDSCYVSHEQVKFPKRDLPYKIVYEAYDSCHNVGYDSCYIYVKDRTRPVAVADKGVTVSLSDKKVWVDAETFDEGSWDNCGVNFILARRSDWYEACINLCDSIDTCYVSEHHDTLWQAFLETDKHVDEVEAYYAKQLEWLCEDDTPCGEIIYNAWKYDLMKYATLHCKEHPYEVSDDYFKHLFKEAIYYDPDFYYKFSECSYEEVQDDFAIQLSADIFGYGHYTSLSNRIDMYSQIGGGWSDAVPFSCEDACGPVTVEILVMDYWCNWSTAWTKVWVEDKTPVKVAKDVVDGTITCKVYKDNNYAYPGEQHPVSIEYIVDQAKSGEADAYAALDGIFGGYCKAWVDPYGNFVDIDGYEIDCDIPFYDSVCYCTSYYEQVRLYDDHLGYIWVDSLVTHCYYEADTLNFQKGIVAVNCAENVYCEQEVWCDFDHCGQGYIYRKFKIWQGCPAEAYAEHYGTDSLPHIPDTIYRHQKIYVGNECELNKYMFDVPGDVEVFSCSLEYGPDGNVTGVAGPENTGYAKYLFDDDCRIVGIAHEDKVFKIVGGDAACYKILRTWYFADWCNYGGDVATGSWWLDPGIVVDKCVQKIIVTDTVAPVCVITGPVESGDTVTLGACEYTLEVDVDAMDECGLTGYYWELKDITNAADHLLIDSGSDALDGGAEESFSLSIEGLLPGTYKLKVEIQDECTNESYCEYVITVASGKKPTPVCITSLTARLTPWDSDGDGEVDSAHAVVWAYEFDRSSTPACGDDSLAYRIEFLDGTEDDETAAGDLDYLEVGCADVGSQIVRMWVISLPSDTRDYCDAVLVVQSDGSGCPTTQGQGGDVMTYEGDMTHTTPGKDQVRSGDQQGPLGVGDAGNGTLTLESSYLLEQNRPNPFQHETMIGFVLPESMVANLEVFDLTGRLIKSVEGSFVKGFNAIRLEKKDLNVSGVLYYRLRAGDFVDTKKMIVIE